MLDYLNECANTEFMGVCVYYFLFWFAQVIVAIISFLETMLLMYLSYKVKHTHTHKINTHRLQAHQ